MNWRFTRAGTVRFEQDEPFCFLTLVPHGLLDRVEPEIRPLDDDPALRAAYDAYAARRADFNGRLASRDPAAVSDGWQRTYMRGDASAGRPAFHRSKRRLQPPAEPTRAIRQKPVEVPRPLLYAPGRGLAAVAQW